MAKGPRAGKCKTRLCPPLSLEQAAELYRCFLIDSVNKALAACSSEAVPTGLILAHPDGDAELLLELVPSAVRLETQRGVDLGARLQSMFDEQFAAGNERVVIIGADSPNLPASFLHDAFATLADCDVVLGPARDGGYYLIGLRRPHPRLFEEIAWSTNAVCAQTLERAGKLSLRVNQLPLWYDIDTVADLRELYASDRMIAPIPKTAAFLQSHASQWSISPLPSPTRSPL